MTKVDIKIKRNGFFIFLGMIIYSNANTYFKSKEVHFNKYDFVVTKVTGSPTGHAIPFKENQEMDMCQYYLFPKKIIKAGDSIHKGSEEKYLFIFRKDEDEKFILIDSIEPTGMFSWNYKN